MLSSRERVIKTLRYDFPDRAPRDLWALPYISLFCQEDLENLYTQFPMDIESPQTSPGQSQKITQTVARAGQYQDEWGSTWSVGEPGVIGEVKEPALGDWARLKTFLPPWELIQQRDISSINRSCDRSDKFMLSEVTARPFERLQFLRGSQNLYFDIGYGTSQLRKLLDMVHHFYLEDIRSWCETQVDGIVFMDDWGTNSHLLINPQTWRELFKPLYREYVEMIHSVGKYAFFHSDGNIEVIFGDFIDIGIDAINSQLFCMDFERLGSVYRGKITFWGEIDRQYILPFGSTIEVESAVQRVRRAVDDGRGGVIAQCEWGKNNPKENIQAVYKAWLDPILE